MICCRPPASCTSNFHWFDAGAKSNDDADEDDLFGESEDEDDLFG